MNLALGDCLAELPKLGAESIDLIVTDPPYGISFMGKDWDKAVPSVEVWKECLRVLKPGAFAFVMALPRLDVLSQMAIRLQAVGFNVEFTPVFWAFASGFPKAMNMSKAVMKKVGDDGVVVGKKVVDVGIQSGSMHAGRSVDLQEREVKVPSDPRALSLNGSYSGFQPKPAVEVIIVAMKPLSEKTYVEQALKNGKGITWLDDARLPFQNEKDSARAHDNALGPVERFKTSKPIYEGGKQTGHADTFSPEGRFPANLIVSDDVLNDSNNWKAGGGFPRDGGRKTVNAYGDYARLFQEPFGYGDSGSFSRYFSLDAWWADKVKELSASVRKTFPFLIEPKASKKERNEGLEGFEEQIADAYAQHRGRRMDDKSRIDGKPPARGRNHHPTVKPVAIMSYLITLGSRPNDVVLDPFMGSGTTGIACRILNRDFVGIEVNPEYYKIAEARLRAEVQVGL